MSIDPFLIVQDGHISQGESLHFYVPVSWANQRPPRQQQISRLRFLHLESAGFIQSAREHLGKTIWHVLYYHESPRKVSGKLRQHVLQRVRPSSRNPNRHHTRRSGLRGQRRLVCATQFFRGRVDAYSVALGRSLDLGNQLLPAFLHTRSNIGRLSDEIKSSKRQCLQRYRSTLSAMRTDHDHWQAMAAHDLPQHIEPAHTGHLQIQCYHLRF